MKRVVIDTNVIVSSILSQTGNPALLKSLGSNRQIMDTPIFSQEQIARAVELGLGASSPDEIELITDDDASEQSANRIKEVLRQG